MLVNSKQTDGGATCDCWPHKATIMTKTPRIIASRSLSFVDHRRDQCINNNQRRRRRQNQHNNEIRSENELLLPTQCGRHLCYSFVVPNTSRPRQTTLDQQQTQIRGLSNHSKHVRSSPCFSGSSISHNPVVSSAKAVNTKSTKLKRNENVNKHNFIIYTKCLQTFIVMMIIIMSTSMKMVLPLYVNRATLLSLDISKTSRDHMSAVIAPIDRHNINNNHHTNHRHHDHEHSFDKSSSASIVQHLERHSEPNVSPSSINTRRRRIRPRSAVATPLSSSSSPSLSTSSSSLSESFIDNLGVGNSALDNNNNIVESGKYYARRIEAPPLPGAISMAMSELASMGNDRLYSPYDAISKNPNDGSAHTGVNVNRSSRNENGDTLEIGGNKSNKSDSNEQFNTNSNSNRNDNGKRSYESVKSAPQIDPSEMSDSNYRHQQLTTNNNKNSDNLDLVPLIDTRSDPNIGTWAYLGTSTNAPWSQRMIDNAYENDAEISDSVEDRMIASGSSESVAASIELDVPTMASNLSTAYQQQQQQQSNGTLTAIAVPASGPQGPQKPGAMVMMLLKTLYGVVFTVGFIGNTLVISVILRNTKMQTVTNMYILNLALADLMFLTGLPFLITTMSYGYWPFGKTMCKIYMTTTSINQFTSSLVLTVMSADRYIAVCHPISSPRFRTPFIAKFTCLTVWAISAVLMVPIFIFSSTDEVTELSCNIYWPEYEGMNGERAFTLYSFTLGFAIPLSLILIFYFMVLCKLRGIGPKGQQRSRGKKKSHRKVTQLVFAVIFVYLICWLPYWIGQVSLSFLPAGEEHSPPVLLFMVLAGCLSYTNSAVNPILYAFLSENFKKRFKRTFTTFFHQHGASQRGAGASMIGANNDQVGQTQMMSGPELSRRRTSNVGHSNNTGATSNARANNNNNNNNNANPQQQQQQQQQNNITGGLISSFGNSADHASQSRSCSIEHHNLVTESKKSVTVQVQAHVQISATPAQPKSAIIERDDKSIDGNSINDDREDVDSTSSPSNAGATGGREALLHVHMANDTPVAAITNGEQAIKQTQTNNTCTVQARHVNQTNRPNTEVGQQQEQRKSCMI